MTSNVKVVYVQPQHDLLLIRGESHKSRDRKMSTDKKTWRKFVLLFFQWELIRFDVLSTINQDNELGLNHDYKRFWRLDWHWGSLHQCCVSVNPLIVLLRCRNGKMCVYTEWTVYLKNENSVVIQSSWRRWKDPQDKRTRPSDLCIPRR